LLQEVAATGSGLYFFAGDTGALQQAYARIDMLERSDVEKRVFVRWKDRAATLLVAAPGLLVGERVLRHTLFQMIP